MHYQSSCHAQSVAKTSALSRSTSLTAAIVELDGNDGFMNENAFHVSGIHHIPRSENNVSDDFLISCSRTYLFNQFSELEEQ
jgi:hypothetical protein